MSNQYLHDVLIIGSGASGLSLALQLAQSSDNNIAVISKAIISEGATFYAQGGISAVLDNQDSIESHVQDTLKVGNGLCDPEIVKFVVEIRKADIVIDEYYILLIQPVRRSKAPWKAG